MGRLKIKSLCKKVVWAIMLVALIYVAAKFVIGDNGIVDQVDVLSALVMYLFLDKLYKDN